MDGPDGTRESVAAHGTAASRGADRTVSTDRQPATRWMPGGSSTRAGTTVPMVREFLKRGAWRAGAVLRLRHVAGASARALGRGTGIDMLVEQNAPIGPPRRVAVGGRRQCWHYFWPNGSITSEGIGPRERVEVDDEEYWWAHERLQGRQHKSGETRQTMLTERELVGLVRDVEAARLAVSSREGIYNPEHARVLLTSIEERLWDVLIEPCSCRPRGT